MSVTTVDESPPVVRTFNARFDWQIEVAEQHPGVILNVGANEDPANLKERYGERVVNCDIEAWDKYMDRPNNVDRVFNCLETPWPVDDLDVEVVIFGDILEHFTEEAMLGVLGEAHRVSPVVAITVPEDTRIDEDSQHNVWSPKDYNLHTVVVTREILESVLRETDWQPERFWKAPWGFDDIDGYCVVAHRV